jgi:nicotinamidase-related amidase
MTTKELKPSETAVIVVDMLNDFISGSLKVDRAEAIVPRIKALLAAARAAGAAVVYSCDAHSADDHEVTVAWQPHAMAGTDGAQVIAELAPAPGDHVSYKTTYSGFYKTDLEEYLERKGVKTVVLTGVLTSCCIQYIAGEAFVRGYRVIVPEDCVETFSQAEHDAALEYVRFWYKADTRPSQDVVRAWRG